ncbi:TrbI/VirB10 family protein [Sphingomonas soli]|uniref:TrbI/VirB10 family protein n=1 Tax=Sphingomonas soli TaxID=266127 RepID=UPI00082CF083|nr:TrbI/VirB10 family protein [Sphingomonas soli]
MNQAGLDAIAPKVDPETLAIRARPRRPIRFRRGVIIAISAVGSVSLIAVTWMALSPKVFNQLAREEALSQPSGKGAADALSGLPTGYGDVPKLGPPLPGDLGRPILEHQRQLAAEDHAPMATEAGPDQAAAAERERLLAERKAARESGLLVSRSQGAAPGAEPPATVATVASPTPSAKPPLDQANDPNAQQRKLDFVATVDPKGDVNPHVLVAAPSPYVLTAGSVISASLITGLRSDLPGLVIAQVTERVYDSPTGRTLLIPQGARLIGSYDSVVAFGQKRALIVWQRIVMPDDSSLRIDNVPATDPSGYAGLEDKVDMHSWQLLKGVTLSTVLGVGSELAFTGDGDLVEAMRRSTQGNVSRAGDQITQRNLNIQPTITIRPGAPVRLVVHKDLVLAPQLGGGH